MPGPRRTTRLATPAWSQPALLLGVALLTYARAFGAGWMWDDDANVTECAPVQAWNGLATLWLDPRAIQQYYPVLHSVFWAEHKLWGLHPMGYHAVNVLLHAVNAILFWRLLVGLRIPDRAAWIAALLFVVHPVHVESVAWVTEMKNTLSLSLALVAAGAWLRWAGLTHADEGEAGRARLLVLFYSTFALALLAKSVTMTLPVALLIVAWWKRGGRDRRLWSLAPCFAAAAAAAWLTIWLESENVGVADIHLPLSPAQRVLLAGRALWFYAWKLAFPADLSFVYPRGRPDPGSFVAWLFPVAALGTIAALLLLRRRIGRGPAAAALIWTVMLAPMLGFVDLFWFRYSDVSDHFQYHASLAPLTMAGLGIAATAAALDRWWKQAGTLAIILVMAWLGLLSAVRVSVFHDSATLWTDTLRHNPDAWIAWNNLGRITLDEGRSEEAETMLRRAIAIDDRQHEPWNNLGIALMNRGRQADALAAFRRAKALHPSGVSERENLGRALFLTRDWPEAVEVLRDVVADRRHGPGAELDLGEALARSGRWAEAEEAARDAHQRFPSDTRFHLLFALTLRHRRDVAGARAVLEAAAALDGRRDPVVLDALAITMASAGAFEDAARIEEEALALRAGPGAEAVLRPHLEAFRRGEVPR